MKPCLVDINVLLALLVATHPQHAVAANWYRKQQAGCVGMCRFAQLGLVRLLGNRQVMSSQALTARAAWDLTVELLSDERLIFWSEPASLDECLPKLLRYPEPTPVLVGDAYFAAFAMMQRVPIITFDKGFRQFQGLAVELLTKGS